MSRYVDKPHGLTLGSGNIFFVIDRHHPERPGEIRDGYTAIISFRSYEYAGPILTGNYFIETPAQQLIWRQNVVRETQTFGGKPWPVDRQYWTLKNPIRRWLDQNIGEQGDRWDTYTQPEKCGRNLFFKRRKDALAFCNMIDAMLKGIKIGDW